MEIDIEVLCRKLLEYHYNYVSNLRKNLKVAHDLPDYVKSVYGIGYKFEI